MKKIIIAFLVVSLILSCPFAAFADGGAEVAKAAFTDGDKATEIGSLYDFFTGVGLTFTYKTTGSVNAYGVLLLKKNGKIVDMIDQEFELSGSGLISFDKTLVPDMSAPGRYKACFYLFDGKNTMNLVKGGEAEITGEVFPEEFIVSRDGGLDFEDESLLKNIAFYISSGTLKDNMRWISTDQARHGNSSLAVQYEKAWDRVMTAGTFNRGAMRDRIRALGDGKYRVSGYMYPTNEEMTFSPRIVGKNTAVSSSDFNYTTKVVVPAGKWTYFSADYDVVDNFSKASTLDNARPQLQLDKNLSKGLQTVFIDDLALTKIDEPSSEMEAEKNLVVKVASDENVIVTATDSSGDLYAIESAAADSSGVAEAVLSLKDGYNMDDITVNVYAGNVYTASASDAIESEGVKYLDFRYLSSAPINGVSVKRIVINNTEKPYDEIALGAGALNIETLVSTAESKNLKLYAAKYKDGVFKETASSAITSSNGFSTLTAALTSVAADDTVSFFVTDDKNTLMSNLYTLDASGLTEKETLTSEPGFTTTPSAEYNPVGMSASFEANVENPSTVLLIAYPSDSDYMTECAYMGVTELDAGENSTALLLDTEKFNKSRDFVVDYYTVSPTVHGTTAPFSYLSAEDLEAYYKTLNDPTADENAIASVIETPALKIDLTDYNTLSSKNKEKALELFAENNENHDIDSATDIQDILDESCATVMFCTGISAEAAERLGEKIMSGSANFKKFKSANSEFKTLVADLITKNAVSSDKASVQNAEKIFDDAFVTAELVGNAGTYGEFMTMATDTYAAELGLNTAAIGSLSKSEIFKYMYSNRKKATNTSEIKSLFDEAIAEAQKNANKQSSGSSGGGGGGGGRTSSGSNITYTVPETDNNNTEPAKPARTLFKDMADSHWALESVLFLNSIGVIADAENFRPDDKVLREEVVKMLVCAFGELDKDAECDFTDVDKESWCYPYIASAVDMGFISGTGAGNFGKGNAVSRQDCAVMIYRIVKDKLDKPSDDYEFSATDAADVSEYALEAIKALSFNGIMNGYGDGSIRPLAPVSRAECAKLITSVFGR